MIKYTQIGNVSQRTLILLTSSLFCAITWRVLKINELRQKYGWLWVAQAKKCTFVPCMYARNITDQVPQAWLLSAKLAANIRR